MKQQKHAHAGHLIRFVATLLLAFGSTVAFAQADCKNRGDL